MSEKPKFKPVTVNAAEPDGHRSVPGVEHDLCPGLAVAMPAFGVFNVTHLSTGMRITGHYERFGNAQLALAQWAAITHAHGIDWSKGQEEMFEQISRIRDQPVPFEGATETSGGVARPLSIKDWMAIVRTVELMDEFPWEETSPGWEAEQIFEKIAAKPLPEPPRVE